MTKPKCIIVDIDGTLAEVTHRRHHVRGHGKKNWMAFFDEMVNDPPIQHVIDIVGKFYEPRSFNHRKDDHDKDYEIILSSGRPDNYKEQTIKWLAYNDVPYDRLMMRKAGDNRSDVIVKREMLREIQKEFDVYFVLDDRQEVVNMWREEGLHCLQVAPGDFSTSPEPKKLEGDARPNLYIMVGPSGAGKSTFIDSEYVPGLDGQKKLGELIWPKVVAPGMVISSDGLREQLCGDFKDQSKNDQVFAAFHDLARTRLKHGLDVVLDATHLRNKDRKESVKLGLDYNAIIHYVVINRPLKEKIATGGWRNEVNIKGKTLVEQHDNTFNSNLKDILNKDGFKDIILHDYRSK